MGYGYSEINRRNTVILCGVCQRRSTQHTMTRVLSYVFIQDRTLIPQKYTFGLIICIPLTNRASPILRFQAGSAITMECICVHKYIYSDYIFYILQVHIT